MSDSITFGARDKEGGTGVAHEVLEGAAMATGSTSNSVFGDVGCAQWAKPAALVSDKPLKKYLE